MPRLNRDIDLAIKAAMGAVAGGMMLAPDEAEAMYVGPKAKGWGNLPNKFSSLMDRMERAEISDAGARLTPELYQRHIPDMETVLSHPELFREYPNIAKMPVFFKEGGGASFIPNKDAPYIEAGRGVSSSDLQGNLLHEIQHAIQEKEGWARGGSPANEGVKLINKQLFWKNLQEEALPFVGKDKAMTEQYNRATKKLEELSLDPETTYRRLAGEIEARDTAARMGLSATERASRLPFSGQGIPLRDVITKGGGTAASVASKNTIKVPIGYLDWAHGPAAESGNEAASRLFSLPVKNKTIEVDLSDPQLVKELKSVAELWADRVGLDKEWVPMRHTGTARKILQDIESLSIPKKFGIAAPVAIGAAGAMMPMEAGAAPTKPVMTMTDIVNKWRAEGRQIPYLMEKEAWREQAQAGGRTKGLEEAINPAEYLMPARVGGGVVNMAIDAAMRGVGF